MVMKLLGFLLLVAGWAIVLSAVVLLVPGTPRSAFAVAGVAVEVMGFVLVTRSHPLLRGDEE
jgi:hypothetical protein